MDVGRHLQRPSRKLLYIIEYSLVRHRILVPYQILLPHIYGHGLYHPVAGLVLWHCRDYLYHILDIAAVMRCHQRLLGHRHNIRRSREFLPGRNGIG